MTRLLALAFAACAADPGAPGSTGTCGDQMDGKCDSSGVVGSGNGSLVEMAIAADTSPLKTLWWPAQQEHDLGRAGAWDHLRGWSWTTTSSDGAGAMVRTTPRPLFAGNYMFSLQLTHKSSPGASIGTIRVLADGQEVAARAIQTRDFASGDWQREAIAFALAQTANVSFELDWDGTVELWTGMVLLAKPGRPFFNIAHNPNSLDLAFAALDAGANAIEPDIQHENGTIDVREQAAEITDPITHADVRSDLAPYLAGVATRSDIAAMIWDIKPTTEVSYGEFGTEFTAALDAAGLAPNLSVLSLQNADMSDFWPAGSTYGRDVSSVVAFPGFNTDPTQWYAVARANAVTFMGMGISNLVPIQLAAWYGPLTFCVNGRDRYGDLKKLEYWTVGDDVQVRKMLDMGVDGVIADDNAMVARVLQEDPYRDLYRLATPDDDPAAVHGFPYGPSELASQ